MDNSDGASSETIEFGGSPRWMRGVHRVRGAAVEAVLIALAIGVAAGFVGGRITGRPAHPHSSQPAHTRLGTSPGLDPSPISFTGNRCATQVGWDLQLGIELENDSASPLTIGIISAVFPLGGLSTVAAGTGPCGALPGMAAPTTALKPGATEWITITADVRVSCPEPLPVAFKLGYEQHGKLAMTRINGFPDLGPVPYWRCGHEGQGGSAGAAVPLDSSRRGPDR